MSSPKIFISYSAGDGQDYGEWVSEKCRDRGYEVFWSEKDISPGDYYERKILEYISKCNFFILIGTWRALDSSWVEKEFLEAKRLGKRTIICIHKKLSMQEIEKTVVGKSIVNQIDYSTFGSGPSIVRIVDELLRQQMSSIESSNPLAEEKNIDTTTGEYIPSITNSILSEAVLKNMTPQQKEIFKNISIQKLLKNIPPLKSEKSLTEIWNEVVESNDFKLIDYQNAIGQFPFNPSWAKSSDEIDEWDEINDWDQWDSEAAITDYEETLVNYPERPQLWINKGWSLKKLGRQDEALECFRKAKAIGKSVIAFHPDGRPLYKR